MRPRLKEDPREWRKFAGAALAALWLVTGLLWHRGRLPQHALQALGVLSLLVVGVMGLRPHWLRALYRPAMTFGFYLGQGVGRALLALAFVLVFVPLGLMLRLTGKDLLRLKRNPGAATYWEAARRPSPFDRQF
jgi:hypothetical protein